ncbi:type II secretion system F family protein [Pelotomaculum propionicicum]|uniref:type II secretion system F family protein n=1 Tax=Pelotomaculum propionicicum TaxID=258475 RepID=UPI003B820F5A
MTYLPVLFVAIAVFILVILIHQISVKDQSKIKSRLKIIQETQVTDQADEVFNLPFQIRIIDPIKTKVVSWVTSLLPANLKATVDKKLIQCGNPRGMKAGVFLSGVIVGAVVLSLLVFFIVVFAKAGVLKAVQGALIALLFTVLAPYAWLYYTADKRIKVIERTLPDAIDLLVVSVEAGLGFDMALSKVSERMKGPLGDEFTKALNEMKMGKNRQSSLRDLSNRVGSDSLSSFLSMIIQGTTMGFAIGPILRIQSETMRRVRRQKAEEAAMKAPIKMVFPLVLCIFPALFIVILGPALIQVIKAF